MSSRIPAKYRLTDSEIKKLIKWPHTLGHLMGYDLLDDIHTEWIKYCWLGKGDRSLQAHRNSYKTTAILIVGTIWWLTFCNPEERILFLRKSWDQAAAVVKSVKMQFESDPIRYLYKSCFDIDNLRGKDWRDSGFNLVTKENITPETNLTPMGVGGNITGGHYTKIFTDDIITIKDRVSRAERENTKTYIKELTNIVTVDGETCNSGTPWHNDDAWKLLPKPKRYPVGSIDIKGFTPEKVLNYRRMLGTSLYAANYELKHIADEDQLFLEPAYGKWPEKFKRVNAWCDPSYQGKATTALSMIGIDKDDKAYVRGWIWYKHIIDCYKIMVQYLNFYKCGSFFVETNADKGYSKRDLSEMFTGTLGRNEPANKHIKIISFAKQNWDNLIFADDCQPEYVNQIMDYSEDAELKDAADSLASLIREMRIGKRSILERF